MMVPIFSREEFNKNMLDMLPVWGIIPTDEAYDSYRHFVLNKFAPINPPGCSPIEVGVCDLREPQVTVTPGTLTLTTSETRPVSQNTTLTQTLQTSVPALKVSMAA